MNLSEIISTEPELAADIRRLVDARSAAFGNISPESFVAEPQVVEHILDIRRRSSESRVIIGLTGFPASGKTTLARLIERQINAATGTNSCAAISMDGFHRSNASLEQAGLTEKKGAPETYDSVGFGRLLAKLKHPEGCTLFAPSYDRPTHAVVENSVVIPPSVDLIVVEGIYVGYRPGDWSAASAEISNLYFFDQDIHLCLQRVINRNRAVGRSPEVIIAKLKNDVASGLCTLTIMPDANYIIEPFR
jgi:pantothenate kinase